MNQRTRETRYYEVNGAEEYSAMESAEGQVQNLGYQATFPNSAEYLRGTHLLYGSEG